MACSLTTIVLIIFTSSSVIANNLVRMTEGDILRFDTMNSSGLWNLSARACEVIVIAHE